MKRKKLIKISKLKKKAEKEFHKWIVKRDKGICFTCGKTGNQAGHFKHGKLDFWATNLHCQCARCNYFLSGNLGVYAINLEKKYGQGTCDMLLIESQKEQKFTRDELEALYSKYKILNNIKNGGVIESFVQNKKSDRNDIGRDRNSTDR